MIRNFKQEKKLKEIGIDNPVEFKKYIDVKFNIFIKKALGNIRFLNFSTNKNKNSM